MNQSGKSNSVEPDTGDPVLMPDVSAEEPRVDDATSSEGHPGKSTRWGIDLIITIHMGWLMSKRLASF